MLGSAATFSESVYIGKYARCSRVVRDGRFEGEIDFIVHGLWAGTLNCECGRIVAKKGSCVSFFFLLSFILNINNRMNRPYSIFTRL